MDVPQTHTGRLKHKEVTDSFSVTQRGWAKWDSGPHIPTLIANPNLDGFSSKLSLDLICFEHHKHWALPTQIFAIKRN